MIHQKLIHKFLMNYKLNELKVEIQVNGTHYLSKEFRYLQSDNKELNFICFVR